MVELRINALGEAGENTDWLTSHAEYERLGRDAAERQNAYRQLFRTAVSQDDLVAIPQCAQGMGTWARLLSGTY